MNDGPQQRIVVYTDRRDGRKRIYCTAYTKEQERDGIAKCVARRGTSAEVHSRRA